jgi:hypothetical protein
LEVFFFWDHPEGHPLEAKHFFQVGSLGTFPSCCSYFSNQTNTQTQKTYQKSRFDSGKKTSPTMGKSLTLRQKNRVKIQTLRKQGYSRAATAKEVGCSLPTVDKWTVRAEDDVAQETLRTPWKAEPSRPKECCSACVRQAWQILSGDIEMDHREEADLRWQERSRKSPGESWIEALQASEGASHHHEAKEEKGQICQSPQKSQLGQHLDDG